MAAFADPFDALLISDGDIFGPPAVDEAGQSDFDPSNPGPVLDTIKLRVSSLGKPREFKSDKKVAIAFNKIFMRPYAGLTEKHWIRVNGVFYNILGIDDPGLMGHHFECYVQSIAG